MAAETVGAVMRGDAWGRVPGLSGRERNLYRLASEMAGGWGRVGEETWGAVVVVEDRRGERGVDGWLEPEPELASGVYEDGEEGGAGGGERLTREEVATLAQVLASALFVSVLVNCAEGGERVLQPRGA